jgi:hypothetical protein
VTLQRWLNRRGGTVGDFVFPSRVDYLGHLSTQQCARLAFRAYGDLSPWLLGFGEPVKQQTVRSRPFSRRSMSASRTAGKSHSATVSRLSNLADITRCNATSRATSLSTAFALPSTPPAARSG